MHYLLAALLVFFGGLSYRIGGSEITGYDSSLTGMRVAKLAIRGLPYGLSILFYGLPLWVAALVWLVSSAADSLPHGEWQGTTNFKQIALLTFVSLASAIPASVAMYSFGLLPLACIAGLFTGIATYIGNKLPIHFSIRHVGFNQGPEVGEVLRGAARMLFVI